MDMNEIPFHELTGFEVGGHGLIVFVLEGEGVAVGEPGGTKNSEIIENVLKAL